MTDERKVEHMTDAQYNTTRNDLIAMLEEIVKRTVKNPVELRRIIEEFEAQKNNK